MLGALTDLSLKAGIGKTSLRGLVQRVMGLPRSVFGTAFAHFGLGITLLGIVATTTFATESVLVMKPGDGIRAGGYTLRFDRVDSVKGSNYTEDQGKFTILNDEGQPVTDLLSAKRFFPVRKMQTTEAGIKTFMFSQLYVSLGDAAKDGGIVVRIWWKPLVTLIWLGGVVMMIGGGMSLLDRRLRIGAPAKSKLGQAKPRPARATS
jgi:cytochrome c-type biogenesis protein CcmF